MAESYMKIKTLDTRLRISNHYRWDPHEVGTINEDGTAYNGNTAAPMVAIILSALFLFVISFNFLHSL